ncbi:MAG: MraY family glycosyltransferase [Longicatena sp.]|jgi:UDP-GlcNAc:undecaprenyl-phosphate GlcNAc-1-phosphate transferase|nr:MraY family glycosyltransferase [Longicatena sp.]
MDTLKYMLLPFLCSALLTPLVQYLAVKLEVYAEMNERTVHTKKIARIGGVSIYVAFLLCMAYFMKTDITINGILIGGSIMFFGGLVDDMVNLPPKVKLLIEVLAAIVLMVVGKVSLDIIRLPFGITIDMGLISFLVTFVWIIGITNAVNLIDGLDGLSGGICTIILIVIACLSTIEGRMDIQVMSLILAGSTLGFLLFNWHPASIFMGDCGALFLGFIISAISLLGFKSSTIMTLALPILLLMVPIVDTLGAIVRRKLSGHKFSDADKKHVHHLLMQRFGHRNTVLILYVVTALFGFTAFVYIVNKVAGLIALFIMAIIVELFLEISGMIAGNYHPLLSIYRRLTRKKKNQEKNGD